MKWSFFLLLQQKKNQITCCSIFPGGVRYSCWSITQWSCVTNVYWFSDVNTKETFSCCLSYFGPLNCLDPKVYNSGEPLTAEGDLQPLQACFLLNFCLMLASIFFSRGTPPHISTSDCHSLWCCTGQFHCSCSICVLRWQTCPPWAVWATWDTFPELPVIWITLPKCFRAEIESTTDNLRLNNGKTLPHLYLNSVTFIQKTSTEKPLMLQQQLYHPNA